MTDYVPLLRKKRVRHIPERAKRVDAVITGAVPSTEKFGYLPSGPPPVPVEAPPDASYSFFRVDYLNAKGRPWRGYRVASSLQSAVKAVIESSPIPLQVIRIREFNRLEFFNHLLGLSLSPKDVLVSSDRKLALDQGLLTEKEATL